VTQFHTTDGTDNGDLSEITRYYVQNGQKFNTPATNVPGLPSYNSIKDSTCASQKTIFGETNDFAKKGGLKQMGKALDRGMVLVMSLWDDHDVNMLWLDSDYPLNKDRNQPGVQRGSCATSSGDPNQVESQSPNSSVKYMNVKVGPIGTTAISIVDAFLQ
jgi:cellulose 1,4-beta-cellobiosidase